MATQRTAVAPRPLWESRWVEWGALVLLILIVSSVLWRYGQQVRAQAERAAVQGTLGALRTALVLEHAQSMLVKAGGQVTPKPEASAIHNPFKLLRSSVPNYAGEVPAALLTEVAPGHWVFDERCGCVGYKPQDDSPLEAAPGAHALWFVLQSNSAAPTLRPMQSYVWGGQVID